MMKYWIISFRRNVHKEKGRQWNAEKWEKKAIQYNVAIPTCFNQSKVILTMKNVLWCLSGRIKNTCLLNSCGKMYLLLMLLLESPKKKNNKSFMHQHLLFLEIFLLFALFVKCCRLMWHNLFVIGVI